MPARSRVRLEAEPALGSQLDPDEGQAPRSRLRVAVAKLVDLVIEGEPPGLGMAHFAPKGRRRHEFARSSWCGPRRDASR